MISRHDCLVTRSLTWCVMSPLGVMSHVTHCQTQAHLSSVLNNISSHHSCQRHRHTTARAEIKKHFLNVNNVTNCIGRIGLKMLVKMEIGLWQIYSREMKYQEKRAFLVKFYSTFQFPCDIDFPQQYKQETEWGQSVTKATSCGVIKLLNVN